MKLSDFITNQSKNDKKYETFEIIVENLNVKFI